MTQKTSQEILTKAIEKAIAGGWDKMDGVSLNRYYTGSYLESEALIKSITSFHQDSYFNLIFNHDFAKALWGEKEFHWLTVTDFDNEKSESVAVKRYEYHLQQMVIAENPLEYLGEHLDG